MENYISKINKISPNDPVSGQVLNTIFEELQHNIDLLYRSYNSSLQNWNVSEMIFGNMADYDQTGNKRYINGGQLDSLEKILSFGSTIGTISFEEYTILNNETWLRWDVPEGVSENIILVRNIAIPEHIRHQKILIAFKMIPYEGNNIVANERYEIYINGVLAGLAETGIHQIEGIWEPKTIYGTYNLTGSETNIEIMLARSITEQATPANYKVRISNIFVGLHSLGNSSYSMNYPTSGSSFIGVGADVSAFYDFDNNAIRPIPAFLINGDRVEGTNSSITVNITSQAAPSYQDTFYVGAAGSGNYLGTDANNIMPASTFFAKESFPSGIITVYLSQATTYGTFTFNKGVYQVYITQKTSIGIDTVQVSNSSSVTFTIDPAGDGTVISIDYIEVLGKSNLAIDTQDDWRVQLINKELSVTDYSNANLEVGAFNQPISADGLVYIADGSQMSLVIADTDLVPDITYGYGVSTGAIQVLNNSILNIDCNQNGCDMHIGRGYTQSIYLNKNSYFVSNGFDSLSTSSIQRKFKAKLNSNIEINHDIQHDGGPTAFTDVELLYFSSFGSTLPPKTFTETLSGSLTYTL